MTGDTADIRARLISVLPPWFGDDNPIRDALLTAAAAVLAFAYSLYAYAKAQTRIATATGIWLDVIAYDFFRGALRRNTNEGDDAYRARILANLFRPKATRQAISDVVESIAGEAPTIVEPFSPRDCGAYGVPLSGYGVAGRYGSSLTPATVFILTRRPALPGIAYIGGWHKGPWGYGAGKGAYSTPASAAAEKAIYDAIAATKAEGVTVWVAFTGFKGQYFMTEDGQMLATEDGQILVA